MAFLNIGRCQYPSSRCELEFSCDRKEFYIRVLYQEIEEENKEENAQKYRKILHECLRSSLGMITLRDQFQSIG